MARAAVERLPTISITSPSLRPRSAISLSGRRAKPRPLSAGGRLATWTRRDLVRSIVSASGTCSPGPRCHAGCVTAAHRRGFNNRSIFDRPGNLAHGRPRSEAGADRSDLVDHSGDDDRVIPIKSIEAALDHLRSAHGKTIERSVAAEAGDLTELGPRRAGAQAADLDPMRLQLLVQRFGE